MTTATAGIRVVIVPLAPHLAALVVVEGERSTIALNEALKPTARGRVLLVALNAHAAPRPTGVPFAGVVAMRAVWCEDGRTC